MKFDDILAEVTGFGRFQIMTILLMTAARMTLPFHYLLNNFIAAVPSHHCDITSLDYGDAFRNLSHEERLIVSIPVQEDGTLSSCQMFAEPQYHLLIESSNITDLPTVPCQNGWMYDNTTFKSTLATEWDLVCDKRRLNKTLATIFFIGVMLGAAVFGYLSDRFGRKKALLVSYVTSTVFGFTSTFSSNFTMFAVMRFFTGLGLSGSSMVTVVLSVEWVDIKHRTAVGILMSIDWSISTALFSLVAYCVNDWRYLTATVTCPMCLAIICLWWLPESARWLISNGKVESAHFYLTKCAKVNGREQFMADLKPEVLSKVIVAENENKKYSFLDLVRTPRMRRLALLTGIVWFAVACTYYGLSLNIEGFGVNIYLTQFIFGTIEVPGKALIYFTVKKIGRRFSQAGSLVLTGLCVLCNIFIPQDNGVFRTAVGALGKMLAEAAFTALYLYTTELYPTVMRQNGMGYCSFLARIGVALSPLIQLLEEVWGKLPSTIFTLVTFAGALSASFLPETKNVRLPETIEDVEQTRYLALIRFASSQTRLMV
ncbi:solute carrier family 22 member 7-like isoform X1 [Acanthopagrus latus]|uniref:solute carrier family 22 member 7-like isoform X1 n=1 Tax=Acanthopagrus latus TaxID=8177 RepID=UPI00187BFB20|nr:solute carrier family 22 member 7-like isoform X1 [Acanthopagrus latus]